jgi:hypothetical protein
MLEVDLAMLCIMYAGLVNVLVLTAVLQKKEQQEAAKAEGGGSRRKKVTAAQLRVQKGELNHFSLAFLLLSTLSLLL